LIDPGGRSSREICCRIDTDFEWDKLSDDAKRRNRAIELNQGRAVQMGILGLMAHEKLGNVGNLLPPHF